MLSPTVGARLICAAWIVSLRLVSKIRRLNTSQAAPQTAPQTVRQTACQTAPQTAPRTHSKSIPRSLPSLLPRPSSDRPPNCAPQDSKMLLESEPVIETLDQKFGHNVATRMSRKRPKVVAWFLQICKEMLHGGASRAGGSGRFLDTGLATFWPNLN